MFNHKSDTYLHTENGKLYYEIQGNLKKPALLFLHGGLRHIETLNPLAQSLAQDFMLIGLDSRGHGKSALGKYPLTYKMMEEDTLALIKHLNLEKVSIIGHSDGGIIAYRIAANYPEMVDHLITIGSRVLVDQGEANWEEFRSLEPVLMEENMPAMVSDYYRLNPNPMLEHLCVMFRSLWMDASDTGHPAEKVRGITTPSLLLRGRNDLYLSTEALAHNHRMIPNSIMAQIPEAKHDIALENPGKSIEVIRDFLLQSS